MKKYQTKLLVLLLGILAIYGCNKDEFSVIKKNQITGYVQKGPFITGTQIIMTGLSNTLDQGGTVYTSQIVNNLGAFEFKNIELPSEFVELSANGYYFNELKGEISSSPLTLFAIAEITNEERVNINILTHLEKRRIEYLVKEQGFSFAKAKKTAQAEVLSIFGFDNSNVKNSELLNINENNDDSAVLLAISVIIQGLNDVGPLTEILSRISNDIYSDGILDDKNLVNELRKNALLINVEEIKNNLGKRYNTIGLVPDIPKFEKYIQAFLAHTAQKPFVSIIDSFFITTTTVELIGNVCPNSASTNVIFQFGKDQSFGDSIVASPNPINGNRWVMVKGVINNLEPNTPYFFRLKAVNEKGTSYSDELSIKTLGGNPLILSAEAIDVKKEAAILKAKVNPNYFNTQVYFEYGKTTGYGHIVPAEQNPISGNNNIEVHNKIFNLETGTTYHFRVKAENQLGLSYSDDFVFTTEYTGITGKIEDIEGNVYKTIGIGHQMWMAENLRTTKFNDGSKIQKLENFELDNYSEAEIPAYCWYNNDSTSFAGIYGALYNYSTIESNKLCPAGWHVPDEKDWNELIDYVGGYQNAGGMLKERGNEHWLYPNTNATDAYGFNALPGGYYSIPGLRIGRYLRKDGFNGLGEIGVFWIKMGENYPHRGFFALTGIIDFNKSNIVVDTSSVRNCISVRCIKY